MESDEPEITPEEAKVLEKTRVLILKLLNERRYTLSELSKLLDLSKPTILHHTKILENAGYIRRIENGKKWIYYELTDSGRFVLQWRKVKVIIPLILAAITAIMPVVLFIPQGTGLGVVVAVVFVILAAIFFTIFYVWRKY